MVDLNNVSTGKAKMDDSTIIDNKFLNVQYFISSDIINFRC